MINKTKLTKTSIFISLMMGLSLGFAGAVDFKMNIDGATLSPDNFVSIHFRDNNNDFGGLIYFANVDTVGDGNEAVVIKGDRSDDPSYKCRGKVTGFYYNSERGERLWPLDDKTKKAWKMTDLQIDGGLYTRCEKEGYSAFVEQCEQKAGNRTKDNLKEDKKLPEDYEPTDDELDEYRQERKDQCVKDGEGEYKDDYSYYGTIIHTYKSQKFGLVAGVEYYTDPSEKWISVKDQGGLSRSFQRYDNKYPVGLIYDYNGGLGFVGCQVKDANALRSILGEMKPKDGNLNPTISDLFTYDENYKVVPKNNIQLQNCGLVGGAGSSLIGMIVEGLVGMSNESEAGIIGGQDNNSKMQYFGSANINNATLINFVRQRAEVLCRGKWQTGIPSQTEVFSDSVVCLNLSNLSSGKVEAFNDNYRGKTLVVKGDNVDVVVKANTNSQQYKYDIFVDGGTLRIDNVAPKDYVFKYNGFISNTASADFDTNVNNALQTNCNEGICTYEGEDVAVGALLQGNFIVKGKIKNNSINAAINKKYFVYGKFNTDSSTEDLYDLFAWRCEYGQGSDGYRCPPSSSTYPHPYQNASLVIIDQDYASPLFW